MLDGTWLIHKHMKLKREKNLKGSGSAPKCHGSATLFTEIVQRILTDVDNMHEIIGISLVTKFLIILRQYGSVKFSEFWIVKNNTPLLLKSIHQTPKMMFLYLPINWCDQSHQPSKLQRILLFSCIHNSKISVVFPFQDTVASSFWKINTITYLLSSLNF